MASTPQIQITYKLQITSTYIITSKHSYKSIHKRERSREKRRMTRKTRAHTVRNNTRRQVYRTHLHLLPSNITNAVEGRQVAFGFGTVPLPTVHKMANQVCMVSYKDQQYYAPLKFIVLCKVEFAYIYS